MTIHNFFGGEECMNIYSQLLKQLNMCGHAVLVTDYPTSDTSDGTAASATLASDRATSARPFSLLYLGR